MNFFYVIPVLCLILNMQHTKKESEKQKSKQKIQNDNFFAMQHEFLIGMARFLEKNIQSCQNCKNFPKKIQIFRFFASKTEWLKKVNSDKTEKVKLN